MTPEQRIAVARITEDLERGNRARQLLGVVDQMRKAQRDYFADKKMADLKKSKELEKQVDAGLEESVHRLAAMHAHESALKQSRMKLGRGGLGLRNSKDVGPCAFLGACNANRHLTALLLGRKPPTVELRGAMLCPVSPEDRADAR